MISRKINYTGNFDKKSTEIVFAIVGQVEITGEVKVANPNTLELYLEGDLANITLIQHQIKDRLGPIITDKNVESLPYQNFTGISLIR